MASMALKSIPSNKSSMLHPTEGRMQMKRRECEWKKNVKCVSNSFQTNTQPPFHLHSVLRIVVVVFYTSSLIISPTVRVSPTPTLLLDVRQVHLVVLVVAHQEIAVHFLVLHRVIARASSSRLGSALFHSLRTAHSYLHRRVHHVIQLIRLLLLDGLRNRRHVMRREDDALVQTAADLQHVL